MDKVATLSENPTVRESSARICRLHGESSLTLNEIHLLAYRKWVDAGKPRGDGVLFWIRAENELVEKMIDSREPRTLPKAGKRSVIF